MADLLYQIEIVNVTGKPITFNVKIEKQADYPGEVNVRWPMSGFEGKTEKQRCTVALLPKIRCQQGSVIEQLRFIVDYQFDEQRSREIQDEKERANQRQQAEANEKANEVNNQEPNEVNQARYADEVEQLRNILPHLDSDILRQLIE